MDVLSVRAGRRRVAERIGGQPDASDSDMFAAETLNKVRTLNPRIQAIELEGSHDLAGDNPNGLAQAIRNFLTEAKI